VERRIYKKNHGKETSFRDIGCAKIVENAIINPSKYIDAVELYAIASRDPENARRFSNKYSIKVPLQSYQEILDDPNVDFVYIALPNTMHSEWAMKAAAAKKTCSCRKTFMRRCKRNRCAQGYLR